MGKEILTFCDIEIEINFTTTKVLFSKKMQIFRSY